MEKAMKARKTPSTDSIEELARFWDTHDLTEFDDQLEAVGDSVFKRAPSTAITVPCVLMRPKRSSRLPKANACAKPPCFASGW